MAAGRPVLGVAGADAGLMSSPDRPAQPVGGIRTRRGGQGREQVLAWKASSIFSANLQRRPATRTRRRPAAPAKGVAAVEGQLPGSPITSDHSWIPGRPGTQRAVGSACGTCRERARPTTDRVGDELQKLFDHGRSGDPAYRGPSEIDVLEGCVRWRRLLPAAWRRWSCLSRSGYSAGTPPAAPSPPPDSTDPPLCRCLRLTGAPGGAPGGVGAGGHAAYTRPSRPAAGYESRFGIRAQRGNRLAPCARSPWPSPSTGRREELTRLRLLLLTLAVTALLVLGTAGAALAGITATGVD
jgi:hypothetical protein